MTSQSSAPFDWLDWAVLVLGLSIVLAVNGCTPLAAYSIGAMPYGHEIFGKDKYEEAYKRQADIERHDAGYPPSRRGAFECRNKTRCERVHPPY